MAQKKTPEDIRENNGPAKDLYEKLSGDRQPYESAWKEAAKFTLPYLLQDNSSGKPNVETPYASIGATAVNSLAAKLNLALLPPNGSFFRLFINEDALKDTDISETDRAELDKELAKIERDVVEVINEQSIRTDGFEMMKYIVVTGNVAAYKHDKGLKVYSPLQYVVDRDYMGEVLTGVIKEEIGWEALPSDIQEALESAQAVSDDISKGAPTSKEDLEIYTVISRDDADNFTVYQEVENILIPSSLKTFSKDKNPFMFLRWGGTVGQPYAIGLVEQYLGDFKSLNGLTQSVVEGAGLAAMTLFGIRPGSPIKVKDLNDAKNGEFISGDLEREVSVLRVQKNGDFQTAVSVGDKIEARISKAFMMLSGNIRDSERTTATEVRALINELETTLGGVYSVLASDFQKPLIRLLLDAVNTEVLKVASPAITTGLSAISRERDFQNISVFMKSIQALPPDLVGQYIDFKGLIESIATSLSMDITNIVKSDEQLQKEQQQQQQAQQQQAMQEAAVKSAPVAAKAAMEQQGG